MLKAAGGFHGRDGFGPDVARFRARAFDFEAVARVVSQQAFGHLAARGISRAEYENSFFSGHGWFLYQG
jgi:hypothetical protein